MVIEFDALGRTHVVRLPSLTMRMHLPGLEWVDGRAVPRIPSGFERWISVAVNQPLDPLRPRGVLISPRSASVVSWINDPAGERLSTTSGAGAILVRVRGDGPPRWHDEFVATHDVLVEAVSRANGTDEPSVVADLWVRAQHAMAIADYRGCLIDLGTIAERALAELDPEMRSNGTLGMKVRRVREAGITLPEDIDTALVRLRNRVVHDAYSPSMSEADRAGELVESIAEPVREQVGFVAIASTTPANSTATR